VHKYKHLLTLLAALALAFVSGALAQSKTQVRPQTVEATVMITRVDPQSRSVTFRGPRGAMRTVRLPPDAPIDTLKPGDRFRVRYYEPVAFHVFKDASASVGASAPPQPIAEVELITPPDAPRPGAMLAHAERATGVVEAIDAATRHISLRLPQGEPLAVMVDEGVDLKGIGVGDPVTVDYTETVAVEMIPQPPPAPVGG
jgi:Cu/Ag efflux protein CusF